MIEASGTSASDHATTPRRRRSIPSDVDARGRFGVGSLPTTNRDSLAHSAGTAPHNQRVDVECPLRECRLPQPHPGPELLLEFFRIILHCPVVADLLTVPFLIRYKAPVARLI